ncbi:MAG: patatin-like phospholipase family protein [Candidatus Cloacimonetes bacterium]|nr:patatin-like phospholipase family protein [Candidatus Cloacimonadota bacterium]
MLDFLHKTIKNRRLGIALGGGGARGLAHIGFLKVLDELDITPQIISGTSIGALIGAMYCSGLSAREIENHYNNMSLLTKGRLIDLAIPAIHGLIKGEGITRLLHEEYHLTTFENLKIPLKIVATDFWNREEVVLDSGDLVQAVRASISIPGIFEPVKFRDKILTDGGAVNPVPYDIIRNNCDILIAIDVIGQLQPQSSQLESPNIFECIINSFHIMETTILENQLEKSSPDFIYQPGIVNVSIIDFTRYAEIIQISQPEIERFRQDMMAYKAKSCRI